MLPPPQGRLSVAPSLHQKSSDESPHSKTGPPSGPYGTTCTPFQNATYPAMFFAASFGAG
jgi:hypothetical protein